jgi:hypothetical protein
LQTIALFVLWGILESLTHLSDAITIDRDGGAALRLAAFLTALGLLLGQCYTSPAAEFWKQLVRLASPIALLLGALIVEFGYKRSKEWTFAGLKRKDVLVATAYLVIAGLCIYITR